MRIVSMDSTEEYYMDGSPGHYIRLEWWTDDPNQQYSYEYGDIRTPESGDPVFFAIREFIWDMGRPTVRGLFRYWWASLLRRIYGYIFRQ